MRLCWKFFYTIRLEGRVEVDSFEGRQVVALSTLHLKLHTLQVSQTSRQLYKMLRSVVLGRVMLRVDLCTVDTFRYTLSQNLPGHASRLPAYIASPLGTA
jgi:hypothetical protein